MEKKVFPICAVEKLVPMKWLTMKNEHLKQLVAEIALKNRVLLKKSEW